MEIEIINWDKYFKPRKGIQSTSWLRLQNDFWRSHKFFDLDNDQKMIWVAILSIASEKMKAIIKINTGSIAVNLRIKKSLVENTIKILSNDLNCLKVRATRVRHTCDTHATHVRRTRDTSATLRNERNERNEQKGISSFETNDALSPKILFELWNKNKKCLPTSKILTDSRKNKANSQIRKYPDPTHWTQSLEKFTNSSFCRERWRPGFDDWLNENKRLKALEGNYDDLNPSDPFPTQEELEGK